MHTGGLLGRSSRWGFVWGLVLLAIVTATASAIAGNTYINDLVPNESVTEPNCYDFDIVVSQASGGSATLSVRVFDVDEEAGELDTVSLNGVLLGYLSGTDGAWSTTTFDISGVVHYAGQNGGVNTVEICVDPGGGEPTDWTAEIDWGQILIDGGSAADADIVSLDADGTWDAIQVETLVHATNPDEYRLEINLLDSTGNNKDIAVDLFTLAGGATSARVNTVALPSEPTATETFTVEANLFNHTTGIQQQVASTTWTYSANGAPTASDSAVTLEEDTVYAFAVGDFGYSDPDGDPLAQIQIAELTTLGALRLAGQPVALNDVVTVVQLDAGSLTYTPLPNEHGIAYDSFRFRVHDGTESSASTARMTLHVDPVGDPLIAFADRYETTEDTVLTIPVPGVLANDTVGDGGGSVVAVSVPDHGTVVLSADGSFVYTPDPRYSGADRFDYELTDVDGDIDRATVQIEVLHVNHPPVADAGGPYFGVAGEPLHLSGRYSRDPDLEDRLEYRWDTDGDGVYDTGWSADPGLDVTYDAPFNGRVTLEVRDLYRFRPTGTRSTATALAIVAPQPPEIQSVLFLDLDGNGERDDTDVGLPEIPLLLDGELLVYTDETGQVRFPDLAPGEHRLEIPEEGLELLASRGYGVEEFIVTVVVAPGEPTLVTFASQRVVGTVRGLVFIDADDSGAHEDGEAGVAGVRVALDGQNVRTTSEGGFFLFLHVPVGEHVLTVTRDHDSKSVPVTVLGGVDTVIVVPCQEQATNGGFLDVNVEREPASSAEEGP
jgi:hypothetical protein